MGYIYKITNDINNKVYIGLTTTTVEQRWSKHIRNAQTVKYTLYKAMRKHGVEHFSIETLEECDNKLLCEREIYYIKLYDSYKNGYNDTLGGEGNTLYEREKIYNLWDHGYSIQQIAKKIGCVRSVVYSVLLDYKNYSVEESINRRSDTLCKKVCQFNLQGDLLATYDSEKDAYESIQVGGGMIGCCCNNMPGHKTVGGYIWTWEEDKEKIDQRIDELKQSRRSVPEMQKVVQYTLDNEFVAIHNTAKEAAMSFGRKKDSHIGDCCKGRRNSAFGYKWKYLIN